MGSLVPATPAVVALEEARLGYAALSLSNWASSGVPQIIGNVEIAGALYTFPSLEDISGLAAVAAGPVWVKLVPAVGGTVSAAWTSVAPTWSDEKQGWYSPTVGEEGQRYVFKATKVDASNVTNKAGLSGRVFTEHSWEDVLDGDAFLTLLGLLSGSNLGMGDYALLGCYDARERVFNVSSYTKASEIKSPLSGTVRLKARARFSLSSGGYLRFYKNGIAVSPEYSVVQTETLFSYDMSGVLVGDLLQVYIKGSGFTTLAGFGIGVDGFGVLI